MSETPISQESIYRARPTLRFAGEEDIRASELLLAMRMEENEGGRARWSCGLSNLASTTDGGPSWPYGADSKLKLGVTIEVYAGDEAAPLEIFRGHVTAIEADFKMGAPPELTVLAEDALARARMARRSKTYPDMAPADVARAIAGELSLRPVIAGLDSPTGTWAQINESDLAFLRRLLARFDADVQSSAKTARLAARRRPARWIELALYSHWRAPGLATSPIVTSSTARGWNAADAPRWRHSHARHDLGPGQGREGRPCFEKRSPSAPTRRASRDRHERRAQAVAEAARPARRRFVTVDGPPKATRSFGRAHVTLTD